MVQYRLINGVFTQEIIGNIKELKQHVVNRNKSLKVTSVTKANPGVVTSVGHGLENNDKVLGYGSGESDFDSKIHTVLNKTDDTFEIGNMNGLGAAITSAYVKKVDAKEKGIKAISAANPAVFTSTGHGYSVGNYIFIQNTGLEKIPDGVYKVTVSAANTFQVESVNFDGTFTAIDNSAGPALADNSNGALSKLINLYANDENTVIQNTLSVAGDITGNIKTDIISEQTTDAGVTIDGVLLKDNEVTTDKINEKTTDAGVTIDGVLLKDNEVNTDKINEKTTDAGVTIDGILLKDGNVTGNAATSSELKPTLGAGVIGSAVIPKDGNIDLNNAANGATSITTGAGASTNAISNGTPGQIILVTANGANTATVGANNLVVTANKTFILLMTSATHVFKIGEFA